jgi:hypothetical protein
MGLTAEERLRRITLELEAPSATCGSCRFTTALTGTWSVEDGRLVWRAAPDPQPRRGPDFTSCCEGSDCGDFERVATDWGSGELSSEDVQAIRRAAAAAQAEEMRAWHEAEQRGKGLRPG